MINLLFSQWFAIPFIMLTNSVGLSLLFNGKDNQIMLGCLILFVYYVWFLSYLIVDLHNI